MKIAYIAPSIIPSRSANSIHVMKMCQAFAKNGHEVTLIVPNRKDEIEQGVEDVYAFYGVERCFRIERVKWYRVKGRDKVNGLMSALKARKTKPDLVYSRSLTGAYFATKLGLSIVFEAHTPAHYGGKISERLFRDVSSSKKLKRLIVITQALKEYYETNFPNLIGKIQVAPDGADPVEIKNKKDVYRINNKRLNAGYVGHLYKGRGIELIIELARLCPWADFHFVGGNKEDVASWKNSTDQKNIVFRGFVPPSETVSLLSQFDVLLAPYQKKVKVASGYDTSQWMSPLKIFEYMAAGKPIIASDLPALREVLKHEKNALLCNPEGPVAWKQSIERIRANVLLGESIGNTALNDFLNKYTWQARAMTVLSNL